MIPALRQQFNANYTPEKYQRLLELLEERCGTPVKFRVCETPCFLPKPLLDQMCEYGKELVQQLNGIDYRKVSSAAIPEQFKVPRETAHPLFVQVDFGLVRDQSGKLQPKLVELQGFPSLYAYQAVLSQSYAEVFGLDPEPEIPAGRTGLGELQEIIAPRHCRRPRSQPGHSDGNRPPASENPSRFSGDRETAGHQDG